MDLDDKILHYLLIGAGAVAGSALQYLGGKLASWLWTKFKAKRERRKRA